jgi:hypothetical protein
VSITLDHFFAKMMVSSFRCFARFEPADRPDVEQIAGGPVDLVNEQAVEERRVLLDAGNLIADDSHSFVERGVPATRWYSQCRAQRNAVETKRRP